MKRALRSAAGVLALCCAMILVSRVSARQDAPQVPWRQYAGDYTQIENVLTDLYKSVSFGPGDECDWERIRMLCHPDVVFYQPPLRGATNFRPYDLEGFIQLFKDDIERSNMKDSGFHERIGRHETTSFGRIAHSYVVFEIRMQPEAPNPLQRGVDSIQLALHDGRWWVTAINTDYEFTHQPIPERILP